MNSDGDSAEIIAAFKAGTAIELILRKWKYGDEGVYFREKCIALHNSGEIDALSLLELLHQVSGNQFFRIQNYFNEIIPNIQAPVERMMGFVKTLVQQGGDDLAAGYPNSAFRKWCENDLSRARTIIELAESGDELACEFLTFALAAGRYIDDAERFIKNYPDKRRLYGIVSLGRIVYSTLEEALSAVDKLKESFNFVEDTDEVLRSNILAASFDIKSRIAEIKYEDLNVIAERATATLGPHTIHTCASILFSHGASLTQPILSAFFVALSHIDLSNNRTVELLDVALSQLIKTPYAESAIRFVSNLLLSHDTLKLGVFDSFGYELSRRTDLYERVVPFWLLAGHRELCEGIAGLSSGEARSKTPLNLEGHLKELIGTERIFVCRKAVAYYFLQSVVAASIIVSALRVSNEKDRLELAELLFDTILRNYGGDAHEYLVAISDSDAAYSSVRVVLERSESYMRAVRAVDAKELYPSEAQRQVSLLRHAEEMRQIRKDSMSQSQILSMVSRSTILHGRKTLSFLQEDGKRRPFEMSLASHSIHFELPRVDTIDPVGLAYTLLILRADRLYD